jgi:uncharacterized protein
MESIMDIHVINSNNKYVVLNKESLFLYSVTENIGKFLESYESRSEKPPENLGGIEIDIAKLLASFDEKVNYDKCNNKSWKEGDTKALCLIISHDCNLQCGYCFADHGKFGGEKKIMSFKTAEESIKKIFGENSSNFILFYGGEPFLNFPLMKDVVDYGNQNGLNIKYTTITNGTIMNTTIQEFIYKYFFALQLSLDGPKEINDMQRFGSVESVHDQALETIGQLKSRDYPLSIKCIITKNSINKLNTITGYLSSLGVGSIAFAEVSLIPKESKFFISDTEYEDCIAELSDILVRNLGQLALGNKAPIIGPIFDILRLLTTKTRKVNYCSAGREYVAVTADGDVYPCHGFVGIDEFKMGNVHEEDFPGESFNTIKNIFGKLNVYTSKECSSCWSRFLCGGDCAVHSYIYNNDLSKPTKRGCILSKSILEALLPEIAEIFQDKTKMQNIMKRFNRSSNITQNPLPK